MTRVSGAFARLLVVVLLAACARSGQEARPFASTSKPATSASASADTSPRPSIDDAEQLTQLFARVDECLPRTGRDGGVCDRILRTAVVLEVAGDGTVTDAAVPNQGQLELAELTCIAAAFRHARFAKLPRPPSFVLPFQVCR